MHKVFISQPMRGKTDEEILAERERAVADAKSILGDDIEVIDSFFDGAPVDANPLWFLGKSLQLLSTADYVYFTDGYQDARGCRIEYECAVDYGINIIRC